MKLKFSNATKESWWKQELYGAQEPSLETGRMPPPMPWHVPWGLAWCPRAEPRHRTHATGPCLVPTSWAKKWDACHHLCHDVCHGALHSAREPTQDTRPVPRGLAWCPWAEPRHVTRVTSRATTTTMTLDMVLEVVLGHVTHAMMRATTSMPWCHTSRHGMCRVPPLVPRHL